MKNIIRRNLLARACAALVLSDTMDGRDGLKNNDQLHCASDTDKCTGDPHRTHEC